MATATWVAGNIGKWFPSREFRALRRLELRMAIFIQWFEGLKELVKLGRG